MNREDLINLQNSDVPSYFPAYARKAWQAYDDVAVDKFFSSCVRESGGFILYDICDAIELVLGKKIPIESLTPRSRYAPDMIRKQCEAQMSGGVMGKYNAKILRDAFEKVRRMFRLDNLKALPLEEVPYVPNTSAGLPTLREKAEDYPRAVRAARRLQAKPKASPPPVILFHRGKNEEEARYVNGYPFEMTLIEGRFFYPYQQAVIQHHTAYAGGRYDFETCGLLNEIRVKGRFVAEFDYSKFDTSIPVKLSSMAFSIIHDSFVMTEQDERDWERITRYFHTSPLLAPDGYIYSGRRHGVPSGSCFTQVVDSIVNAICLEYVQRVNGFKSARYLVLGDDSVMAVDRPISLDDAAIALAELGIRLNVKKSRVHTTDVPPHFLGHDEHHMVMRRSLDETLEKLVTPERIRREYRSKDSEARRASFIERIRDYQQDNPDAWEELEALCKFYQASGERRKYLVSEAKKNGYWPAAVTYAYLNQWYGPTDRLEMNERARWDEAKRIPRLNNHRGMAVFL